MLSTSSSSFTLRLLFTLLLVLLLSAGRAIANDQGFIRVGADACPATPSGGEVVTCSASCFRPDPVCGEDGVTYWCGCAEAACAGARVASRGFCQPGNGGAGSGPNVSGQALLLVHIVWLILLGFAFLFGFL